MPQDRRILKATPHALARSVRQLRRGGLVALPTETVYGLGGDATRRAAVARIYAAKGRPAFNPLIVHVAAVEAARAIARFDARARVLAARFWPGPLTLVLGRRPGSRVPRVVAAGRETLAIRVPAHPVARRLLQAFGRPVVAPSANRSGKVSPTTARHVAIGLAKYVPLILDAGRADVGVESTVVDLSGRVAVLLRPGAVTREQLEQAIGPIASLDDEAGDSARASPGRLASHYAPTLPLRLGAGAPRDDEAFLAFGPAPPGVGADRMINLSATGDLVEAAARLFDALRALDRRQFSGIAVAPIPDHGIGAAINDRLRRAAAPRPARR
ncbi:MAG: threonylcarbamoyl-AMP synthase [Alphaproteobacteria bacterium]|nr:threonylcarbamoyl-AMP synthase [Alphaproteobacteria bacterium]